MVSLNIEIQSIDINQVSCNELDSLNQLPIVSLTSEPERKSSVVIPMSEEVETTTSTDENLNKYIIDGLMVDQDLEVTPM